MAMHLSKQIDDLGSDLRFASRALRRTPALTAIVLLSLALGIGANTAVFTLVDAVMFKLLPVKNPEQLYFLTDAPKDAAVAGSIRSVATPFFGYEEYKLIRDQAKAFSGAAAFLKTSSVSVRYQGRADVADAQVVSSNFFSLLAVDAVVGRTFDETDDQAPGANPVAVVSFQYWHGQLGGDRSIVGQPIRINDTPFTIIGVTPPGFFGLEPGTAPEIWVPASMKDQIVAARDRDRIEVLGRVRPGIDHRQAQADLAVIFGRILDGRLAAATTESLAYEDRQEILNRKIEITAGGKGLSALQERMADPLLVMLIIVGLVLLIACANVATLMMVKAGQRRKEFAIRVSLGASRARLVRQLVTESVLLTACGGLLGILLGNWALGLLLQMLASGSSPVKLSIGLDIRVVAYAAMVMGTAVLLFGLFPALRVTRVDVAPALKENSAGAVGSASRIGGGRTLVVIQVALSLLLLITAQLFIRTLENMRSLEIGFKAEGVLIATMDPSLVGYKGRRAIDLYQTILDKTARLPGVHSASVSTFAPMGQMRGIAMVSVPGYVSAAGDDPIVSFNRVGPDYFETLAIPLLKGRFFGQSDDPISPKVAVINQSMAEKFFSGQDPIGKSMQIRLTGGLQQVAICGLVKDSKYSRLTEDNTPTVYTPFSQASDAGKMTLEVRAESDPSKLTAAIRRTVAEIGPDVPLFNIKTIEQQITESLVQERLTASLSGFFGLLALLLACIGLFGITAHEVARRTNEIGIRMALGAAPGTVLRSVMGRALALVGIGIVIGVSVALFVTPLASRLLFGLRARDPITFGIAAVVMILASVLAGYIPARRAARVDPIVAMRCE
jgi:predicted permease